MYNLHYWITITLADTRCQNAPTLPVKVTGVKSPSSSFSCAVPTLINAPLGFL